MTYLPPIELTTSLRVLPRVGEKMARDFEKLDIVTVRDLLFHFPFRHEDFSRIVPIKDLKIGERATVRCQLQIIENRRSAKKRRLFTEALFRDDSGTLKTIWFNQPYLAKSLQRGEWVLLSGILEESYFGIHITNPVFERAEDENATIHVGRLVPIYQCRGNLTSRFIRILLSQILPKAETLVDWLPQEIVKEHQFPTLGTAVAAIHFPESSTALEAAKRRLSFNELLLAQFRALHARQVLDMTSAPAIAADAAALKAFVSTLPFSLTDGQRRAAWDIIQDMERPRPMNRLLEGDAGSGKTVVAAMAIMHAALGGYRSLYLAPTELLATQHAARLQSLFSGFPITVGLLTSDVQKFNGADVARPTLETKISDGEVTLLIGTHALLNESINLPHLGLVVVDEQHRFGVEQRKRLRDRAADEGLPHLLSMTATPIPRTLALTAYGDLDLSMLRTLPKERKPIITRAITESQRAKTYEFIREELKAGRQGFVICPLISESDKLGVRAATKEHEILQAIFPEFRLGLLHGRLPTEEKQRIMQEFANGIIHLLIATAVVEVGIDVPNATVMIIEGAERFGLAQLHQFRGRIGRGEHPSNCFLFPETNSAEISERLLIFARTSDGFALAEHDLALRGPGEVFGTEQSGFPKFHIADLRDVELLELARASAMNLLKEDPNLEHYPLLQEKVSLRKTSIHLE